MDRGSDRGAERAGANQGGVNGQEPLIDRDHVHYKYREPVLRGFTRTEMKILNLLADGERHSREEIHKQLPDELSAITQVKDHICQIRKRLRAYGQYLICENYKRKTYYRRVILLFPHNV